MPEPAAPLNPGDPIRITKELRLHLLQTLQVLQDESQTILQMLRGEWGDDLRARIEQTRNDPEARLFPTLLRVQELVEAGQGIETINSIISHSLIPKDLLDRQRFIRNLIDLIHLGQSSDVRRLGEHTSIDPAAFQAKIKEWTQRYGAEFQELLPLISDPHTHDVSPEHLVLEHKRELIELAESATKTLQVGNPVRDSLLRELQDMKAGRQR